MNTTQHRKPSSKNVILSLVLLLAISLLSIFIIVIYSIQQVNEESQKTIESHISAVIDDRLNQHAILTKDYSYWDETIKHAYNNQNQEWIDENIGLYLSETFNITDVFIINGKNEAVLTLNEGTSDQSKYLTVNEGALNTLITEARKSGPVPEPVSGILMIDGIPALVGVAALSPENNIALPSPRPIMLMAKRMDKTFLQKLSQQYRLKELRFIPGIKTSKEMSSITVNNPLGVILGNIAWQTEHPGNLVLFKIQFPIIFLLVFIILFTIFIIKAFRNNEMRLQQAYLDLEYHANHDPLTGLANRRLFNELLIQSIHTAKRDNVSCAMLYIDLDDFKEINDNFGHHEGDQLLRAIANRLMDCVRESDIVARIGGDEFIVILININSYEDIKIMAQKILSCLTRPVEISNQKIEIGASLGITIFPADGTHPDELLKKADIALYKGKHSGRNTFHFYNEPNHLSSEAN
ncbi:MAG: diguanylate cyclase [Thioalkalispiraceae bacterium]|jgi:diguanylate cyclase (GGDEF)-like protein